MSTTAQKPATTPIPVQLSATEFTACLLPHLTMPTRGPKCTLGSHRLLTLSVGVLYTGLQWQCWPVPQDAHGKPALHSTTVYRAFATWSADGSLWQAFSARVRHLAAAKHLDTSVLHGDGTNTVAKQGVLGWAPRAPSPRQASTSSPSRLLMAMGELPSQSLPGMKRIWGCSRRG
jgi:hypothetical protein